MRAIGMARRLGVATMVVHFAATGATAQQVHRLEATPKTVTFGYYDPAAPPALRIRSGDIVDLHTFIANGYPRLKDAGLTADKIEPGLIAIDDALRPGKGEGAHFLTGPVFVENAAPGDMLQIDILNIRLSSEYAFNGFRRDSGALPGEFDHDAGKLIWLDRQHMTAKFAPGVVLPLAPFFGSIGVAPATGRVSSRAPGLFGGNLDNRDLVAGSTLFLPVQVAGALVSIGDGHAGQGQGEVDGAALETSLDGRFRFTVRKDLHGKAPRAETATDYISMGLDENLGEAAKMAVREMIAFLVDVKHLSHDDAYMLCSVAGNLVVTQVVDGTVGAHMQLPKSIFKPSASR
ncbi:MAG TPA: acetamidase/formamidase family protein [Vicinamibacterales bacterium]